MLVFAVLVVIILILIYRLNNVKSDPTYINAKQNETIGDEYSNVKTLIYSEENVNIVFEKKAWNESVSLVKLEIFAYDSEIKGHKVQFADRNYGLQHAIFFTDNRIFILESLFYEGGARRYGIGETVNSIKDLQGSGNLLSIDYDQIVHHKLNGIELIILVETDSPYLDKNGSLKITKDYTFYSILIPEMYPDQKIKIAQLLMKYRDTEKLRKVINKIKRIPVKHRHYIDFHSYFVKLYDEGILD